MILVVGGTGYVGRYFCCEMVQKGIDVLALGRSKAGLSFLSSHGVPTQYFDLDDERCFEALPHEGVDAVIMLSACLAELEVPVRSFFDVNTLGVYKVLEWAHSHGITKVVVTSSHKLYNDVWKDVITEEDPVCFTGDHSPYIISKIAAENFVEYYNKDFGMKAVVLRLTGVHGYGEVLGHLEADGTYKKSAFEIFFEKILRAEPVEVWGDQSIRRDHVYIRDVTNALLVAAQSGDTCGVFNIASGVAYSQLEEVQALIDVFSPEDKRSEVVLRPDLPGLTRGYCYSVEKAREQLGWEPRYTDLRVLFSDYKKEWETKTFRNYHFFKEGQAPATL